MPGLTPEKPWGFVFLRRVLCVEYFTTGVEKNNVVVLCQKPRRDILQRDDLACLLIHDLFVRCWIEFWIRLLEGFEYAFRVPVFLKVLSVLRILRPIRRQGR